MAKSSIHIEPVKMTSESHNLRLRKFDYVREDLTKNNFNWGFDVSISERKKEIENLYIEKVGQKMQVKTTPLREGVFLITEEHTNEQILNVIQEVEKKFGIRPVQLSIHRDEGHKDRDSGIWKPNLHAHVVFDWQNKETGKTYKLNQDDMSRLQDHFADGLGMERGKTSTKKHKNALDFKISILEEQLKVKEEVKRAVESYKLDDLVVKNPSFFDSKRIDVEKTVRNFKSALKGLKIEILDLKRNLESEKRKYSEKNQEINELENRLEKMRQAMRNHLDAFNQRGDYIAELERIIAFPERYKIDINSQEIKEIREKTLAKEKTEQEKLEKQKSFKTRDDNQEEQNNKGIRIR